VETGRNFGFEITFEDGSTARFDVRGGRASPEKRMPGAALSARWVGQGSGDEVGPDLNVGPDGIPDVQIALERLSTQSEIRSIRIESGPLAWESGVNPRGLPTAELIRDEKDPTRGTLFFQPTRDLTGQTLNLIVSYANESRDQTQLQAGKPAANARVKPAETPRVSTGSVEVQWRGQDGTEPGEVGPGAVHLAVKGLPRSGLMGLVLSDGVHGAWVWSARGGSGMHAGPDARPMAVRPGSRTGAADIWFAPTRDEAGTTLTLRVVTTDGAHAISEFAGQATEITRRVADPSGPAQMVRPGDDLQRIIQSAGRVELGPGVYRLSQPLEFGKPVQMVGTSESILEFEQPAGTSEWTTAIKIHSGKVHLEGFQIRFRGPVRWREGIQFGPAVIGTTDNFDPPHDRPLIGITLRALDVEVPPTSGTWQEAVRIARMLNATGGTIERCRLRGGLIELFRGPWVVRENVYRGTPAGTFAYSVLSLHETHDVVIAGNQVEPEGGSGKTWRFLVLTTSGHADRVERNRVSGIGPRDGDGVPDDNAPEIILTESYTLRFEGKPQGVAAGGRLVVLPMLQGDDLRTGDVLSVLSGPEAGSYRRVLQVVSPRAVWLERPIPADGGVVSVSPGFVGLRIAENRIDSRGSTKAANLVLVGNLFGLEVIRNHLLGAGDSFKITAAPTERPRHWGWSHAPLLDARIEENTIEDAAAGARIAVEHSPAIKSSRGRVYASGRVRGNRVIWSPAFAVQARGASRSQTPPRGLILGDPGGLDPGSMALELDSNFADGPVGAWVESATLDGKPVQSREISWPKPGLEETAASGDPGAAVPPASRR
jgi:hypothetical protein